MRSLREAQLSRQVAAVKLTNSAEGSVRLVDMLEEDFLAVNSQVYVERAQQGCLSLEGFKRTDAAGSSGWSDGSGSGKGASRNPSKHGLPAERRRGLGKDEAPTSYRADKLGVSCRMCEIHLVGLKSEVDVSDECGSGGRDKGFELMELLDSCPPPRDACFDAFAMASFAVTASHLAVRVRQFARPLFAAEAVRLEGSALMTQTSVPFPECHRVSHVSVDAKMAPQVVSQSFELPRVYLGE